MKEHTCFVLLELWGIQTGGRTPCVQAVIHSTVSRSQRLSGAMVMAQEKVERKVSGR